MTRWIVVDKAALIRKQRDEISRQVAQLPEDRRKSYHEKIEGCLKDPDTYAALNYFFVAGLHHFYLGEWVRGLANLFLSILGVVLIVLGVMHASSFMIWTGIALAGIIAIVELAALFRSAAIVEKYNNERMLEALAEI